MPFSPQKALEAALRTRLLHIVLTYVRVRGDIYFSEAFSVQSSSRPYIFISHASADNRNIERLIKQWVESEIAIWFDRPNDIGIDTRKLAGSIPPNEKWDEKVEVAARQASGMICFISEPWGESEVCRRELQFGIDKFNELGGAYFLRMVLLNKKGHDVDLAGLGKLQKIELFRPRGPRGSTGLTATDRELALQKELKDHLKVDSLANSGRKVGRNDHAILYRINRDIQIDEARSLCAEAATNTTWPILAYVGEIDQSPQQFRNVSLAQKMLPTLGSSVFCEVGEREFRERSALVWPRHADVSPSNAISVFRDGILDSLSIDQSERRGRTDSELDKLIAVNCAKIGKVRIIAAMVSFETEGIEKIERVLRPWFDYWGSFPFSEALGHSLQTILPVLQLHMIKNGPKSIVDLVRGSAVQRGYKALRRIVSSRSKESATLAGALEPLGSVTASCLESWLATDAGAVGALSDDAVDELRRNGHHVISSAGGKISMENWVREARPLLDTIHQSVI